MALRWSGGSYVNTTFTQSVGSPTRSEIVTNLYTQLGNAGWSTITSGTNDYTMQTATTPEGNAVRVRIYDPGSGNCARIKLQSTNGFYIGQDSWLISASGQTFRIVASQYQFFIWTSVSQTSNNYGTFYAAGALALPVFLNGVVTECGWCKGNSIGDGGPWCGSWRTDLMGYNGDYYSHWSGYTVMGGQIYSCDRNPNNDYFYPGDMTLCSQYCAGRAPSGGSGPSGYQGYRWVDNTLMLSDPLLAWGMSNSLDESRIQGQLWDCAIASDAFTVDSAVTIGTHNGYAITSSNTGSTANVMGTLILCYS